MTRNTISTWAAMCLLLGLLLGGAGSAVAQTQFVLIPYEGLVIVVDILTPRNLTVTGQSNGEFELNWDAPNPSPDLTYQIEISMDPSATTPVWTTLVGGLDGTQFTNGPIVLAIYYRVRACGAVGCGDPSN